MIFVQHEWEKTLKHQQAVFELKHFTIAFILRCCFYSLYKAKEFNCELKFYFIFFLVIFIFLWIHSFIKLIWTRQKEKRKRDRWRITTIFWMAQKAKTISKKHKLFFYWFREAKRPALSKAGTYTPKMFLNENTQRSVGPLSIIGAAS